MLPPSDRQINRLLWAIWIVGVAKTFFASFTAWIVRPTHTTLDSSLGRSCRVRNFLTEWKQSSNLDDAFANKFHDQTVNKLFSGRWRQRSCTEPIQMARLSLWCLCNRTYKRPSPSIRTEPGGSNWRIPINNPLKSSYSGILMEAIGTVLIISFPTLASFDVLADANPIFNNRWMTILMIFR